MLFCIASNMFVTRVFVTDHCLFVHPLGEPANAGSVFGFLAVGLFMVYCGVHNWLWPCTVSSEAESALGKVNPIVAHPSLSLLCGGK